VNGWFSGIFAGFAEGYNLRFGPTLYIDGCFVKKVKPKAKKMYKFFVTACTNP